MKQAAKTLGLKEVPPTTTTRSTSSLLDQAMQELLLPIWVEGEAEERGITVSDEDVDEEFDSQKEQASRARRSFSSTRRARPDRGGGRPTASAAAHPGQAARRGRSRSRPASRRDRRPSAGEQVDELADEYDITEGDIETYYDTAKNKPVAEAASDRAAAHARVILNTSEDKVEDAKAELERPTTPTRTGRRSPRSTPRTRRPRTAAACSRAWSRRAGRPAVRGPGLRRSRGRARRPVRDATAASAVQVTKDTPRRPSRSRRRLKRRSSSSSSSPTASRRSPSSRTTSSTSGPRARSARPRPTSELCANFGRPGPSPEGQPSRPRSSRPSRSSPARPRSRSTSPTATSPSRRLQPQGPGAGVQAPPDSRAALPAGATAIPARRRAADGGRRPRLRRGAASHRRERRRLRAEPERAARAPRRRAPRRDHPAAAPRVPLGPRAGRALDRSPHRRGGLRARRRGGARRRRQAARRARRRPLPGPLPLAAARGARGGRPRRGRRAARPRS